MDVKVEGTPPADARQDRRQGQPLDLSRHYLRPTAKSAMFAKRRREEAAEQATGGAGDQASLARSSRGGTEARGHEQTQPLSRYPERFCVVSRDEQEAETRKQRAAELVAAHEDMRKAFMACACAAAAAADASAGLAPRTCLIHNCPRCTGVWSIEPVPDWGPAAAKGSGKSASVTHPTADPLGLLGPPEGFQLRRVRPRGSVAEMPEDPPWR